MERSQGGSYTSSTLKSVDARNAIEPLADLAHQLFAHAAARRGDRHLDEDAQPAFRRAVWTSQT